MTDFNQALDKGGVTQAEAFAIYDALEATTPAFMQGDWIGLPFPTGHPMDGALEATGWRGKRFDSAEDVHPLLFHDGQGGVFKVDPVRLMTDPKPGKASARREELETDKPAARLRTFVHRDVATTAMVYDGLAIIDTFRKVDDDTVLGVMDMRGLPLPYFFVLRRNTQA